MNGYLVQVNIEIIQQVLSWTILVLLRGFSIGIRSYRNSLFFKMGRDFGFYWFFMKDIANNVNTFVCKWKFMNKTFMCVILLKANRFEQCGVMCKIQDDCCKVELILIRSLPCMNCTRNAVLIFFFFTISMYCILASLLLNMSWIQM